MSVTESRRSRFYARLMYAGVALGAGGITLYTPLLVALVGSSASGTAAGLIMCGLNLGRAIGAFLGGRFGVLINVPMVVVLNIVLEGVALFLMMMVSHPLGYAGLSLVAGIGSGLSFPALKNWLLKLKDMDVTRLFAGLSVALRVGMVGGFCTGALIGPSHMQAVFTGVLILFCGYGAMMYWAMHALLRHPPKAVSGGALGGQFADDPAGAGLRETPGWLWMVCNIGFGMMLIQPQVGMSLFISRYVPDFPVSAPYAVQALTVLLLQMPLSRRATNLHRHAWFLLFGWLSLLLGFGLLALWGRQPVVILLAALALAGGPVFYLPSFDVLASTRARKLARDPGQALARFYFYQTLGVMAGSLSAGWLFDWGLRLGLPALGWAVSAGMCVTAAGLLLWQFQRYKPAAP